MYVREERTESGKLGWFVKTRLSPFVGHEELTQRAAAGLPIGGADLANIIEGVRRPDTASLTAHVLPGEQRRHVLRQTFAQSTSAALADAIEHFRWLHAKVLASGGDRQEQFRLIGEALHLIQDSYAPAHVQRDRATSRIRVIRGYGPAARSLSPDPSDHIFPADPRDAIRAGLVFGNLKREASLAIDASREYLDMTLRHLSAPTGASSASDLNAFIAKHLSM